MKIETALPGWVVLGEPVLVRPYSYSGIIAYIGATEFATGIWIGVELDTPTGKLITSCILPYMYI
jgi:kinesin family protein 13